MIDLAKEFKPDWNRVCNSPDIHGWAMTWLQHNDHEHTYWCKFCPERGIVNEDTRQMELNFD